MKGIIMDWLTQLLALIQNEKKRESEGAEDKIPSFFVEYIKDALRDIHDAETVEIEHNVLGKVVLFYIRSLVETKQLQQFVIEPLLHFSTHGNVRETVSAASVQEVHTDDEAIKKVLYGAVVIHSQGRLWAVMLPNTESRSIEASEQETIIYGPRDSFTEQLDKNMLMIRRRLPIPELKSEQITVGTLSRTKVLLLYIEGLTNPELIRIARQKTKSFEYDIILDTSHLSHFLEDHINSVFPQLQQTDRPDITVAALASGKLVWLVDNTPIALVGPTTFFDLFQSPEDYIHRWQVASFLRGIRFLGFLLAMILTPVYVALTMHHYQMIPIEIMYVLLESRSQIPLNPFWESFFMMLTLEILKEASLRMPTKSGQTLGIVGGIVIGQAAVDARIASNILIIHVAITAISSFLIPNYLMTNASKLIQFGMLLLAAWLGIWGIALGLIVVLIHLNGLTSLQQPYFAPLVPFYRSDWKDTIIRLPLRWMHHRPAYLKPLEKYKILRRK